MSYAPATAVIPGYLAGTWKADPVHSEVAFSIRHLMVSNTRGRFTSYDVTIVTSEDPRGSWVTATMDLRRTDGGRVIEGELTLHGVTRQVPLAIEVNGFG